jgi:hypothetical protein
VLKGDFSDEANADKPEEANADIEVALLEGCIEDPALFSGDLGDLKVANGDAVDALAKPDETGTCAFGDCSDGEASAAAAAGFSCDRAVTFGSVSAAVVSSATGVEAEAAASISSFEGAETRTPGPPGDCCASAPDSSCAGLAISSFKSRP